MDLFYIIIISYYAKLDHYAMHNKQKTTNLEVLFNFQGGHKLGKHGKPGKLSEFEKLSKSQGNSGKSEFL